MSNPRETAMNSAVEPRQRRFGLRKRQDPVDSVVIDDEQGHDWWARRDDLSERATPPRSERSTSRATEAAAAAFAPASDVPATEAAQTAAAPRQSWDLESLYEWGSSEEVAPPTPLSQPQPVPPSPWEILSVSPDAHWLEVVRRHRTLAKQFHPDVHANADQATRQQAQDRMAVINAAFDELLKYYGMEKGA